MDFGRFELSKWLFTTLLGNYQSRLSPTDSAEEAISDTPLSNVRIDTFFLSSGSPLNGNPSLIPLEIPVFSRSVKREFLSII